ncbi:hypothetical protein AVEN_17643-1, partial [Araneus ventricosus]
MGYRTLVARYRFRYRRFPGSNPASTEVPPFMGPVLRQIVHSGKMPSCWCGAEVWRDVTNLGVVLVISP